MNVWILVNFLRMDLNFLTVQFFYSDDFTFTHKIVDNFFEIFYHLGEHHNWNYFF